MLAAGPRLRLASGFAAALALAGVLLGTPAAPAATGGDSLGASGVRVIVEKAQGRAGRVTYRYLVINGAASPITSLLVGFDRTEDRTEVLRAPVGWDGERVPATSYSAPHGWGFAVVRAEEDSVLYFQWEIGAPEYSLWSESRTNAFSVVLAEEDSILESGRWTAILDGRQVWASGRLERARGVPAARADSAGSHGASAWLATGAPDDSTVRARLDLAANVVRIEYDMDEAGPADVAIVDRDDRVLTVIFQGDAHADKNTATWNGRDAQGRVATPGAYLVRVTTAAGARYARVVWLR